MINFLNSYNVFILMLLHAIYRYGAKLVAWYGTSREFSSVYGYIYGTNEEEPENKRKFELYVGYMKCYT